MLGHKWGSRDTFVVKLDSWREKQQIMKEKKTKLGGKARYRYTYIDHDLTFREREIARKTRDFAKQQKENGQQVRTRNLNVEINGAWYFWSERSQCFVTRDQFNQQNAMNNE